MKISELLLGQREFVSETQVIKRIKSSKRYDNDLEEGSAGALLIFETSSQHTWVVITVKRVYVVLDDIRRPEPRVQWTTMRFPLRVKTGSKTERTGLVYFNDREKSWLYSKRLFTIIPIAEQIKVLEAKMRSA